MKLTTGHPDRFVWGKPTRVVIDGDYLSADFGSKTYPLEDAIDKARALRALVQVDTDEDARDFTAAWGFLPIDFENGPLQFPLKPFHLLRTRVLALSRLASACRDRRDRKDVLSAVEQLWNAEEQLQSLFRPEPGAPDVARERQRWRKAGWSGEKSQRRVEREQGRSTSPSVGDAMRLLALKLSVSTTLQAVRTGTNWRLEDRPTSLTLEGAILWSIRLSLPVLQYRLCESEYCGKPFLARRTDQRFCGPTCSGRERVRKFRATPKSKMQHAALGEGAARRRQHRKTGKRKK